MLMLISYFLLTQGVLPQAGMAQESATKGNRSDDGISLSQYRKLYAASQSASAVQPRKNSPSPPPDFRQSDNAFLKLLVLQAKGSAARQSQDRLAGWNKAIKPRIDNQSIPALEVEILSVAEKQQAAEVARLEAELQRATAHANHLVGRDRAQPLLAVADPPLANSKDAEGLSAMERDVLTAERDLLVKLFQSYTVGGIDVTELLWYEREATQAEANYLVWAVRAGFAAGLQAAEGAN